MKGFKKTAFLIVVVLVWGHTPAPFAKSRPSDRSVIETLLDGHKVVNVVDDFLIFWDQAKGKSPRIQRRLWTKLVESRHKDYFDRAVYRNAEKPERSRMLDEFLARVPERVEAIRELNAKITNSLVEAIVYLKVRFPEYRHQQDIYLGLSMFRFDGSARPVNNDAGVPDTLCLGADVLADYTAEQMRMTIAHEFFHLYHFGFLFRHASLAELRTAHMPLMIEGLAVAGAEAMHPYLSRGLYLHFSEEETVAQQDQLTSISQQYLDLIRGGAPAEQYEDWFTSRASERVPSRAGYLLGYEVVKRVLAAFTLEQMVRMTPAQLREHAEEQLSSMALDRVLLMAPPE